VKPWIIALCLCIFYFILPLQYFVIGNDFGGGIQGALFRYQMTPRGNSLIPITSEMTYVTSGLYQGRTAFSVGFWVLGTSILTILTTLSLIFWNWLSSQHIRIIILGMAGAGICYLLSCGFQYGLFLSGPAGTSLPIGVILMIIFSVFIYSYQYLFRSSVENSTQINNYEQ
jgi:hypothetical protein